MAKTVQKREEAVAALRELILAGEQYRLAAARYLGLTVSESQAISYLMARGPMGQTDLGAALGFNTSSTTALVDRLDIRAGSSAARTLWHRAAPKGHWRSSSARRRTGCLSAVRLFRNERSQPLRVDAVQGALELPGLPRTVRPLQMSLRE